MLAHIPKAEPALVSASREQLFRLALVLGVYACFEAACFGALGILRRREIEFDPMPTSLSVEYRATVARVVSRQVSYNDYDAKLGWTIVPRGAWRSYRANAQALRSSREYAEEVPPGILRVAAFGDSFTHGNDLANDLTWPALLEQLDPALEVLNYGVGGYGVDQMLLRYEAEGARFRPRVVLIGFMTDDIGRQLSVFRRFLTPRSPFPFSKPRFVLEGDGLRLVPNPMSRREDYRALLEDEPGTLRRLGEHDFFFQRGYFRGPLDRLPSMRLLKVEWRQLAVGNLYQPGSQAMAVTTRVIDRFVGLIRERGARPLIVILPGGGDIRRFLASHSRGYQPFLSFLDSRGFPYADLVEPLAQAGARDVATLLSPTLHYSPLAARVVATALQPRIRATSLP
jgi:lysophospholipase L1-like esterase